MATVTFNPGGPDETTIKANRMPGLNPIAPRQAVGRSINGAFQIDNWGDNDESMELDFQRLTTAQKDDLSTFIQTTVDFAANTFTFRDAFGTDHTNMRCVSPWNPRVNGPWWDVTLRIIKDPGA